MDGVAVSSICGLARTSSGMTFRRIRYLLFCKAAAGRHSRLSLLLFEREMPSMVPEVAA